MFKDKLLEQLILNKGFAVMPAIDNSKLLFFREIYEKLHKDKFQNGHISTAFSSDLDYKEDCNVLLKDFFNNIISTYADEFEIYGTSFVYKTPSENSALRPHQDWSLTDENKYQQINCWIPLCDIDEHNGMIYVLPGTHFKNFPFVRATNVDYYYENNRKVVMAHGVPIKVKAGSVVMFDNSIIHYSEPNKSKTDRVAAVCTFYAKDAKSMMFYHDKDNKKMNTYYADKGFALKYKDFFNDIQKPPKGLDIIKSNHFIMPKFSDKELHDLFNRLRTKAEFEAVEEEFDGHSIMDKVKNFWSKLMHRS